MKFLVYQEWAYDVQEPYEKCFISRAGEDDEQYNGCNIISGANRNGMSFDIYDSLEEAIVKSGFNPKHIDFEDIDQNLIDGILSKYIWNQKTGLILKQQ